MNRDGRNVGDERMKCIVTDVGISFSAIAINTFSYLYIF